MEEKILQQIKINKLEQYDTSFIIAQLCVLNNKPFDEIKKVVEKLVLTKRIVPQDALQQFSGAGKKKHVHVKSQAPSYEERKSKGKSRLDGKICGTKNTFAFLKPFDTNEEDVFISEKNLNGAVHNDTVMVEIIKGRRRREGQVVQVIERGNGAIVGKIKLGKLYAVVTPDDVKFGKDINVPMKRSLGANDGDKVLVKVERYYSGKKMPDGAVVEVLGPENDIKVQVLSLIRSHGLFENFPKKVMAVATEMPTSVDVKKYGNRRDLRKEMIFTIDGSDTRDIDDAVAVKKLSNGHYLLGVHIADVGEYVPRGSVIDVEAFKRGTSVYFPNLVLPMLPRELSNGICSLNPNEDRLALSVEMEIDGKGDVVNHEIFESVIRSKRQFTYDEVQRILEKEESTSAKLKEFVEPILMMGELAKILEEKRIRNGSINFNLPETQVILTETGDASDIFARVQDESHKLIESFMVAANETVATHYCLKKAPFLYRVHENPDEEKIANFMRLAELYGIKCGFKNDSVQAKDLQKVLDEIEGKDCAYALNRICLRSQKKAKYIPQCLGHFGMSLKYYCHFTSPIRRYPDLTIHRIIKEDLHGTLTGKTLSDYKQFVVASGFQSSDREVNAEEVERDVDDLYRALYMSHHIGEEYDGIISGVTAYGLYVELENTAEGHVPIEELPEMYYNYDEENFALEGSSTSYKLGDKVKVKCVDVNVPERKITFVLI